MALHGHQGIARSRIEKTTSHVMESWVAYTGALKNIRLKTEVTWAADLPFSVYINGVLQATAAFTLLAGQTSVFKTGFSIGVTVGDKVTIKPNPATWATFARIGPSTVLTYYVDDFLPTEYGGESEAEITFDADSVGDTLEYAMMNNSGAYNVGSLVKVTPTADLTTWFIGEISSIPSAGYHFVDVLYVQGAGGTFSSWNISITGPPGPQGEPGLNGLSGADGADGAPGADGVVQAIVAGDGISVDNTDPANPVVSTDGAALPSGGSMYQNLQKLTSDEADADWAYQVEHLTYALSDETTNLAVANAVLTSRLPYPFRVIEIPRINVNTAPVGASITVDINKSGSTIFTTKPTIDVTEKTSVTASIPAVLNASPMDFDDDEEIVFDIDGVGSTTAGKGLKCTLIGHRISPAYPAFNSVGGYFDAAAGVPCIATLPDSTGLRDYDIIVAFAVTPPSVVAATPSGWTDFAVPTGNGAVQFNAFWKRWMTGDPTTADFGTPAGGNFTNVAMMRYRHAKRSGSPWDAFVVGTNVTNGGTLNPSVPGLTTLGANRTIVGGSSGHSSTGGDMFSALVNASLANLTERMDRSTTGTVRHILGFDGRKATAGVVSATSYTFANTNSFGGYFVGALIPE